MPETRPHIRRPDLPWRPSRFTECGRPVGDVKEFITRDEALAKIKEFGFQRASFLTCMTCLTNTRQYREETPVQSLSREFFGATDPALNDELRAIAAIVDAHRDEFDGFLEGLTTAVDLAAARRERARRAR